MKKLLLGLILSSFSFGAPSGASLVLAPIVPFINQRVGASLTIYNYTQGGTGASIYVKDILPLVGPTLGSLASSQRVPYAFGKPFLGPGANVTVPPPRPGYSAGNSGNSLIFYMDAKFFSPSISPPYSIGGSWAATGTQTYNVRLQAFFTDGSSVISNTVALRVLPLPLPSPQQ